MAYMGTDLGSVISIHALREEGDLTVYKQIGLIFISIHALREEGDLCTVPCPVQALDFYPRPPRGGRRGRTAGRNRG